MNRSGGAECLAWTWGIAVLTGIFAAALLWVLGGWTFMQGAFMGVLALLVVGALLTIMMCRGNSGPVQAGNVGPRGTGADAYVASGVVSAPSTGAAATGSTPADTAAADRAAAQAEADRVAAVTAQAESDAAAKADADAAATPTPASATPAPAAVPAQPTAAPVAPAAAATPAPASDAAEGPGTRPEALDGPRGGTADDLKRIRGVGPKMETMCNDLGFYHFDQIANWTSDEVAWVDQNLKGFKGRVSRDNWVEQARLLAAGEETAFSKKVDEGDVY